MNYNSYKIGRIIKIQDIHIIVEVTEQKNVDTLIINPSNADFLITINGLIYCYLQNGKKAIARINQITDKKNSFDENIFLNKQKNYLIEANLIGIYDDLEEKFKRGVDSFPIIGQEVYAIDSKLKANLLKGKYKYELEIGNSIYYNGNIMYANPDVLFGKHLGVFGNTGSGKTCTLVSIIQGLKKRLKKDKYYIKNLSPKIIIFDTNDEYERAFCDGMFKVKVYNKNDLKLPHYELSDSEYIKFLNASDGFQAPILKNSLMKLREYNKFSMEDLLKEIDNQINSLSNGDNYNKKQFKSWLTPLYNRINVILENNILLEILNCEENIVENIMRDDNELILIKADFDKIEMDIVIFLFTKLLYNFCIKYRDDKNVKNVVLLLEEAHRYINDKESNDYKLGYYYIERLAREGRKYGISLIISSQRPSELSETVVSQCNSFIVHKITNKKDMEIINKILDINNNNFLNFIPNLEKQHALVTGEAFNYSDIIKICDANPLPRSCDPNVVDSWKIDSVNTNRNNDVYETGREEVATTSNI